MSAESIISVKENDNVSSDDGEDKKFVSQAVAFVIGHARNGFVPLCASVATLLKDQAKLKEDIEKLQYEIEQLKQKSSGNEICTYKKNHSKWLKTTTSYESKCNIDSLPNVSTNSPINSLDIVKLKQIPYVPLKQCICYRCTAVKNGPKLDVPIKKGTKVVISGELCGEVCYTGHVDNLEFPEIHVGIQLAAPVGDTDGSIGNKTYFSTSKHNGLFIQLRSIQCILK